MISIQFQSLLGQVIVEERTNKGVSQAEIANALNISPAAYSRIEKGTTNLTVEHLMIICDRLSISPSEILNEGIKQKNLLESKGEYKIYYNPKTKESKAANSSESGIGAFLGGAALGALLSHALKK